MIRALLIILPFFASAQTLSLSQNESLGTNCGNGQTTEITYEDINLNGYTLTLRNVSLNITGNLNGNGEINRCGNYNHSSVCVLGNIQNNVNLNGITCNTLNTSEFDFNRDLGHKYKVSDALGKVIMEGITSEDLFNKLPYETLLLIKVEKFKTIKIYKIYGKIKH